MGIQATDRNRSLFLKGFNLSRSGANEDPTYLGFKFVFDFGSLPVNLEYGWAPSPLLRVPNYTTTDGAANMPQNMFGQPQYSFTSTNVVYYSAYNYLLQRDGSYSKGNALKRANALRQFQILLQDINNNSPWFFQSIDGLNALEKFNATGFQPERGMDSYNSARTADKKLTINCLESLNMRMTALANLYNQAMFDADNMRWLVPRNLRKFTMWIYVTEIRNFFKTTRLTGSSAAVSALDDLSSLVSSNRNPGGSLANTPPGERQPAGSGDAFSSFTRGVLSQSGLMNDVDAFRNQQDQSGIKPVLIYECQQCEFDFSQSSPLSTSVDVGGEPSAAKVSFDIHVGKVRMKTQFPNIRTDGNYLVLSDAYDQNRSTVQIYNDTLDLETVVSLGREALTNITSQAISDLVNEGIAQYITPALGGISQSMLGNIYSFNPSQLQGFISGNLGFRDAQNFLNGASDVGIDNIFAGNLPTPQSTGQGGPPERLYPTIQTDRDVYPTVPGPDLGVPDRVYPMSKSDAYLNVPGSDLGVPGRVYPLPTGDEYPTSPGSDLGVPDRIYPAPVGDEYPTSPGFDLGVPDRIYPAPGGDEYPTSPGSDLGVPDRVYPAPGGDEYADVPGMDLGVPDRVYPDFRIDEYASVPGGDLGVPERAYPSPGGKVYPDTTSSSLSERNIGQVYSPESPIVAGNELRSPSSTFDTPPAPVYSATSPNYRRGDIGREYPPTTGDFIPMVPADLGNTKGADTFNISLGTKNGPIPGAVPLAGTDSIGSESGVIVPNT